MSRFTLTKQTARKVQSQFNKDRWNHLKPMWEQTRRSEPTSGDVVLWDPEFELLKGCYDLLMHEQQFVRDRQKDGCTNKEIVANIASLKKYMETEFAEQWAGTNQTAS